MRIVILALVVLGGMVIPVQVAGNKRMEQAVASPVLAATLALFVGAVALLVVTASGWLGRGQIGGAVHAPWWTWVAMSLSLFTVVSIIALPRIGAAATIAATVFGQLTAAAVLDHFGWLGVPQVRLNWWRIGGAILLIGGTIMMQRRR